MAEPTALIIEDDRLTAAIVSEWLTEAGWNVHHVEDGQEGLRCFAELRPALVVVDLVLPGIDGITVCATIRMQPYGERARIVVMSARTDAGDAARAAGADQFLAKPLDRAELLASAGPRPGSAEAAALDTSTGAPGTVEPLRPGIVRLPTAAALGAKDAEPRHEEGTLGPGQLVALLHRLHDEGFSGVLEAEGPGGLRAKLFFSRGCPAAARSTDQATGFGQVLLGLGVITSEHLTASIEEGRSSGTPLGEVLLRTRLIERRAVERALREQVIQRAVGIGALPEGRWSLDPAESIGMAGFDVHPAVIAWRLGETAPALTEAEHGLHVQMSAVALATYSFLDADRSFGVLRALLVGGATAGDCLRVCGERAGALLALLRVWKLLTLTPDAPPPGSREAGLAELDAGGLAESIRTEHRALSDANLYTVLGLQPHADREEVNAATVSTLARYHPDALPGSLDTATRGRARDVYERALEAGRVLSDPARRTIYDARLRGEAHLRQGNIGMEDHAVLQADRAQELFRRGEFVTAAALFHMAVQLEGESADILAMLGWARHCACPADTSAGEIELRRALQLDPDDEFALTYLGRLHAARGEIETARELLRAAVERNHAFEPAREALRELGG